MNATRIISVLLFLALIACRTDKIVTEHNFQILNSTDTTITVKFNRGGVDKKTFTIGVNDTVIACQFSGFEGDLPFVYDYVFVHYKDNVFIDSLRYQSNSLLDSENYIEYKRLTIKGIDHVYYIFTVDSEYIDAKSK